MVRYCLDDDIFHDTRILRDRLLRFTQSEGGSASQVVDMPVPAELGQLVKDCFKLTGIPAGVGKGHFGSEIAHHYHSQGYQRIRESDRTLMWFERTKIREAVEIEYSPDEREAIFTVVEYETSR